MKNKSFLLLIIGVAFIGTVIFLMLHSLQNNNVNNEEPEDTLLQIIKEDAGNVIETEVYQKVEYNQMMIDSKAFKYLLKIGKVATTSIDGNEFTDEQKLAFASSYAYAEEYETLKNNAKKLNSEEPSYIKFEYLNDIAKKYFGKEIVKENLSYNFDGEYIEVSLPTRAPEDLYKFKEIRYNKQSDVYSIYFDEINPEIDNYDEIVKSDKIEYNSEAVLATYRILYKKSETGSIILGIHQIL